MAEPSILLTLVLFGGWAALDGTAAGQFMISRPIVSATLAGWLMGDANTGLLVGVILETLYVGDLPAGGARLPETGPASVVAAVTAVWIGGAGGLAVGSALGVLWGVLGGMSVTLQRRLNGVLVTPPEGGWKRAGQLALRHWSCLVTDAFRGAFLTATGLVLAAWLAPLVDGRWPLGLESTVPLLLIPAFLSGGRLLRAWDVAGKRAVLLGVGCALGVALGLGG